MGLLRRSLRGLSPIEARIDLQLLHDSWRHSPGSLIAQFAGLVLLGWMVHDGTCPWRWAVPFRPAHRLEAWSCCWCAQFNRFHITESGYGTGTPAAGWHPGRALWGPDRHRLLGVAGSEWRMINRDSGHRVWLHHHAGDHPRLGRWPSQTATCRCCCWWRGACSPIAATARISSAGFWWRPADLHGRGPGREPSPA